MTEQVAEQTLLMPTSSAGERAQATVRNPYVGPRTFTLADRNWYFGREQEAQNLLALVIAERLTLFYAQSGAGKSSLLNTQLIPALREQARYLVLPVGRVGGELPAGIADVANIYTFNLLLSLDQDKASAPERFATMTLVDFMAGLRTRDGQHYTYDEATAQRARQNRSNGQPPPRNQPPHVLIIDQFEELVTTHPQRWREREAFFQQLGEAMRADPLLWVVLTLREDFIAPLDPFAHLVPGNLTNRFYMQRMGLDAALLAIQRPAEKAGRPFTDDAARQLVDNLRRIKVAGQSGEQLGQYIEPVQLQVVCYQLWEKLHADKTPSVDQNSRNEITQADLQRSGDVDSALSSFYEAAIATVLAASDTDISERRLRAWFDERLITEAGTRGTVYKGEQETATIANQVVTALEQQFLLRTESRAGGYWVELIHDRFVEPIQQANRLWLERQSPLLRAAQAWEKEQDPALLYTDSQLAEAQRQLAQDPDGYSELEYRFIAAGVQAADRWRAQRQWLITLGAVSLTLILSTLTIWATWSANVAAKAKLQADVEAVFASHAKATAEAQAARADAEAKAAKAAQDQAKMAQATAVALNQIMQTEQQISSGLNNLQANPIQSLLLAHKGLTENYAIGHRISTRAMGDLHELLSKVGGQSIGNGVIDKVALSPNGEWLAYVTTNTMLHVARLDDTDEPLLVEQNTLQTDGINDLTFSTDGQLLAWIGPTALTVAQFDRSTGDISEIKTDPISGNQLLFSTTSPQVAIIDADQNLQLFDIEAQKNVFTIESVSTAAFSPDGQILAIAAEDNISLWNLKNLTQPQQIVAAGQQSVESLVFSANSEYLASGGNDSTINLWNLTDLAARPLTIFGHSAPVTSLAFSKDNHWLISASRAEEERSDNTVRFWELIDNGAQAKSVLYGHNLGTNELILANDTDRMITLSNGYMRLWDVQSPAAEPIQRSIPSIQGFSISNDSKYIIAATTDGVILTSVEKPIDIQKIFTVTAPAVSPLLLDGSMASAISANGEWLASGNSDGTVWLWNLKVANSAPLILRQHTDAISQVAFSPNREQLAAIGWDDLVVFWDMTNLTAAPIVVSLAETTSYRWGLASPVYGGNPYAYPSHIAFSEDGKWFAAVTGRSNTHIYVWEIPNYQQPRYILVGHESDVATIAFHPRGNWLVSGGWDGTVRLWKIPQFIEVAKFVPFDGDTVTDLIFSPDGSWLVSTSINDELIRIWQVDDSENNLQFSTVSVNFPNAWSTAPQFTPDGNWFIHEYYSSLNRRAWSARTIGEVICRTAGRNFTLKEWSLTFPRQPYTVTCPNLPADASIITDLLDKGRAQAIAGNLEGAIANYKEALALEPSLQLNPEQEAAQIVAATLVDQGGILAEQGDVEGAIAKFERAVMLDSSLLLKPEQEAKQVAAPALVQQGRHLAWQGNVAEAITKFEAAKALDPSLSLNPKEEAQLIADRGLSLTKPFTGDYPITQYFGENPEFYSQIPYDGVPLKGNNRLDFGLPIDTPVLATDSGRIKSVGSEPEGFGNFIILEHYWGESVYAHLSQVDVTEGQPVQSGEQIGLSGSSGAVSGPLLGFGIRLNPYSRTDGWGGYSDPLPYLHLTNAESENQK